jgi:anti-anti-sigma factor
MDEPALTVQTVRDGRVCVLILSGSLDVCGTGRFLERAALAVDDRTERLILDMTGLAFLDCAGVRALMIAIGFAPAGCPVIVRSLSPNARRILGLLDLDLEALRGTQPGTATPDRLADRGDQSARTGPDGVI